jgi:hypothetical protein
VKNCHCAMKGKKNEKKRLSLLLFLPFFAIKAPQGVLLLQPVKKGLFRQDQNFTGHLKGVPKDNQSTHQSKMQVALFISKNPIELCFLKPFFLFWQNLKWQKNQLVNVKKFFHFMFYYNRKKYC